MPTYTPAEYITRLTRTIAPYLPHGTRPRMGEDVTDKGEEIWECLIPHPTDGRFSVSVSIYTRQGAVTRCALWFGQARLSETLEPEAALQAVEEILADRIVAIVRYKDRDAYDNRRAWSASPAAWLYQLPDDEAALSAMCQRLSRPATRWERLLGQRTGLWELYRWSESHIYER